MKKIILATLIGTLIITLSGCGAANPKPKQITGLNNSSLTKKEKKKILDIVLEHNLKPYNPSYKDSYKFYSGKVSLIHNCFYLKENYIIPDTKHRWKNDFNYCFNLKNNIITTKYRAKCSTSRNSYSDCQQEDFMNDMNNISLNLKSMYNNEVVSYTKFKPLHEQYIKDLTKKISETKITTIDKTNILSSEIMQRIKTSNSNQKKLHSYFPNSAISAYKKNMTKNDYIIEYKNPIKALDRYLIVYKQDSFENPFDKSPKDISLNIEKISFNYLPEIVNAKNKELSVELNPNSSLSNENIALTNLTNSYINVNTISFYYGEDIFTQKINIKLPPQGVIKTTLLIGKIQKNKFLPLNSVKQKVNLGLAVEYTNLKYNKQNSILELKKVSHKNY